MAWLYFIINLALLIFAVLSGKYIYKRFPKYWIPIAIFSLLLLFLEGYLVHRPDIEYIIFPWIDYTFFRGWGLLGAFVVFGIGISQLPKANQRALIIFTVFLIIVRMYFWWSILFGFDYNFKEKGFKKGICYQSTLYTCAPSSCATLLKHYGIDTTEKEMARLCLTGNVRATSNLKAARGLNIKLADKGYSVKIVLTDIKGLEKIPKPCLISVKVALMVKHMVVLSSFSNGKVVILDPEDGKYSLDLATFEKEWSKNAIWIEPCQP